MDTVANVFALLEGTQLNIVIGVVLLHCPIENSTTHIANMIGTDRYELNDLIDLFNAAEHDHNKLAQIALATIYASTGVLSKDDDTAFYWALQAATRGVVAAQYRVGFMIFRKKVDVSTHPVMQHRLNNEQKEAAYWFREAADQGDLESTYSLGILYADGEGGVQRDPSQARALLTHAAMQGHTFAQDRLSLLYETHAFRRHGGRASAGAGTASEDQHSHHEHSNHNNMDNNDDNNNNNDNDDDDDDDNDDVQALYWLRKACNGGSINATYRLAERYMTGRGVKQDMARAVRFYHKLSDYGHADAQHRLAWMYSVGQGVAVCDETSRKWCKESARRRIPSAQCAMGIFCELGLAGEQNILHAMNYFYHAAHQGLDDAQRHFDSLTKKYRDFQKAEERRTEGDGYVEPFLENEVEWYYQAFDQGIATAACCLGVIYEKGLLGVDKDMDKALSWYGKAVKEGCRHLQSRLDYLLKNREEGDLQQQENH
ncbi:hypothetical protein BGZ73_002208 [Actinomortierella ambigua]|nr:hypothetical protein BGZ73_002208 [Actinomortierella ambigua]